MLMEGFLAVTAVLEPHLRLRPAAAPESCSASALPVPGDDLLPSLTRKKTQLILRYGKFINIIPEGIWDFALTAKRNLAS